MFWSIIQQSFNLRICLFHTLSFKMYIPTKKYLRRKAKKLCLMGQIVIESHSFLEYCRALNEMGGTTPPPQNKNAIYQNVGKVEKNVFF